MQKKWVNVLLVLVLAFLAFYLWQKYKVAPEIKVEELPLTDLEGQEFLLASLKGEKTALCFAASWCGPCRQELKMIGRVKDQQMQGINIVVISDETQENIEALREEFPFDFTWLKLEKPFSVFGINSIPTSYLINRRGEVVKKTVGFVDWEDPGMANYLSKLME